MVTLILMWIWKSEWFHIGSLMFEPPTMLGLVLQMVLIKLDNVIDLGLYHLKTAKHSLGQGVLKFWATYSQPNSKKTYNLVQRSRSIDFLAVQPGFTGTVRRGFRGAQIFQVAWVVGAPSLQGHSRSHRLSGHHLASYLRRRYGTCLSVLKIGKTM